MKYKYGKNKYKLINSTLDFLQHKTITFEVKTLISSRCIEPVVGGGCLT